MLLNFKEVSRTPIQEKKQFKSSIIQFLTIYPTIDPNPQYPVYREGSQLWWNVATPWMEQISHAELAALWYTIVSSSQNLPLDLNQWKHAQNLALYYGSE